MPLEKLREPETSHFRKPRDRETTAGMNEPTRDTSWRFSSRVVAAWPPLAFCGVGCRCLASFGAMWRVLSIMRHRVTTSVAKVPTSDGGRHLGPSGAKKGHNLFGQGGVLLNKTASAARELFVVRRAALDRRAQRLRLIRTRKVRSPLDKRSLRLTIYEWGSFDISSGRA